MIRPLFHICKPIFPLSTSASTLIQGIMKNGLVISCEHLIFARIGSWCHIKVADMLHKVIDFVSHIGYSEKPHCTLVFKCLLLSCVGKQSSHLPSTQLDGNLYSLHLAALLLVLSCDILSSLTIASVTVAILMCMFAIKGGSHALKAGSPS